MAEFTYNSAKNINTGHKPFELNCRYHPRILFEDDANFHSKSRSAKKLAKELKNLMSIYQQNLLHTPKLQKRVYNKRVKP